MAKFLCELHQPKRLDMETTIIDLVKNNLGNEYAAAAAAAYGESEEGTVRAINAAIPALLAGLLGKSETAEGANTVHKLATEASGSSILEKPAPFPEPTHPNPVVTNTITVLKRLFGERWESITNMIAGYAGIKYSSSVALLKLAAPVILAVMGRKIKEENLSASELAGWLLGQKEDMVAAAPPGFNLAGTLGLSSLGSLGLGAANMSSGVKKPSDSNRPVTSRNKNSNKWLLPFLVLVAFCILVWYFMRTQKTSESPPVDSTFSESPHTPVSTP